MSPITTKTPKIDFNNLIQKLTVPTSLADLNIYLNAKEDAFRIVKPFARKRIIWAKGIQKTPVSFVYLHGYTATNMEISPVMETLAQMLGANLYLSRLTGHGMGPDGHKGVTMTDWVQDALEALEIGTQIGEKVVVFGTSTGGTLAAWLALSPWASKIAAEILISPNLQPQQFGAGLLLGPGNNFLAKLLLGQYTEFKTFNEKQSLWWDWRHHTDSFIPMMQLVKITRTQDFTKWKVPVLVVYSPADKVVNEKVTVKLFSKVPSSIREFYSVNPPDDPEAHVLAGEARSPHFTQEFIQLAASKIPALLA